MSTFKLLLAVLLLAGGVSSPAQIREKLDLQYHGFATQSFVYSNQNNWNLTNSENGSAAWTEGVFTATAQPHAGLRFGAQTRFYRLGDYGNKVHADWALVEYKFNDRVGVRGGIVKTPTGVLNETQDIDPANLWVLLPQALYPIGSRSAVLSHQGGVLFGTMPLGERAGKLEYRGWVGHRSLPPDDPYLDHLHSYGITAPEGIKGRTWGGRLHWRTPLPGLTLGVSYDVETPSGKIVYGPFSGNLTVHPVEAPTFAARYDHGRFMLAGEYARVPPTSILQLQGLPLIYNYSDLRGFYVMTSWKITQRLTAGTYYSNALDHKAPLTSDRYQKDWDLTARYDFGSYFYLKAEQHFIDGTLVGFDSPRNLVPLEETTRLSFLKLGVNF